MLESINPLGQKSKISHPGEKILTMSSCVAIISIVISISVGNDPIDPNDSLGQNVDFIQHKFYDIFFYPYNETLLDRVKLINNPNAIIQQTTSNTDDS